MTLLHLTHTPNTSSVSLRNRRPSWKAYSQVAHQLNSKELKEYREHTQDCINKAIEDGTYFVASGTLTWVLC